MHLNRNNQAFTNFRNSKVEILTLNKKNKKILQFRKIRITKSEQAEKLPPCLCS